MSADAASHILFEVSNLSGKRIKSGKDDEIRCSHYFGYLSKHGKDSDFPDECLICPDASKCIFVPSSSLNAELFLKAKKGKKD